jgi:16S rRNA (guanine1207-N2)-methyltransferase
VVALGAPQEIAALLAELGSTEVICYQMDLYQADRLRAELAARTVAAKVDTAADLWDLPSEFRSVYYPAARGGERALKIDMVEQAFHLLGPRGALVVSSPYEKDQFFPDLLKKIFGRVHATQAEDGIVFWCHREGDRPRRRHEVLFHARVGPEPSLRFLSRPGVFSYRRFDDGARALVETMAIEPGDRVLDLGCGCGTNGIFAARSSGPLGFTTFVDSNLRAAALTEHNARANGVSNFQIIASSNVEAQPATLFDVVLANPPYYAHGAIAELFAERAAALLKPGGRFYLVTRQADQVGPIIADHFGATEAVERRGYVILSART